MVRRRCRKCAAEEAHAQATRRVECNYTTLATHRRARVSAGARHAARSEDLDQPLAAAHPHKRHKANHNLPSDDDVAYTHATSALAVTRHTTHATCVSAHQRRGDARHLVECVRVVSKPRIQVHACTQTHAVSAHHTSTQHSAHAIRTLPQRQHTSPHRRCPSQG